MSAAAPFRLAAHLAAYPEDAFVARLRSGIEDCDGSECRRAGDEWRELAALGRALHETALAGLRMDHGELFGRAGDDNPMSETEYGGRSSADLADIAGFYLAFGGPLLAGGVRVDHLAVELEFYGWLCAREEQLQALDDRSGVRAVRDGRRKFLCEHLGPSAAALASRPDIARHAFYGPALTWCAGLVRRECWALGVEARLDAPSRRPTADAARRGAAKPHGSLPAR